MLKLTSTFLYELLSIAIKRFNATNTEAKLYAANRSSPVTLVISAFLLVSKLEKSTCPNNAQNRMRNVPSILPKEQEKMGLVMIGSHPVESCPGCQGPPSPFAEAIRDIEP